MTHLMCWPFLDASTDVCYGIADDREPGVYTNNPSRSDLEGSSLALDRVGLKHVLDGLLVLTNFPSGSVCTRSFSGSVA